jgi:hypothetical protein
MNTLDASTATCQVFTYKEGLLSAVAHDLKIEVRRFTMEVDPVARTICATFDATSLTVVCAMKDGVERPDALSPKDRRDIEENIAKDVLVTKKFRDITFRASQVEQTGAGFRVRGELRIRDKAGPVTFMVRPTGDNMEAQVRLHQPDFGIKPFAAMLGALKIKPDIEVRLAVPRKAVLP